MRCKYQNISIALNGTSQKRGHTFLSDVVTDTSVDTEKFIDVVVKSKYSCCKRDETIHEGNWYPNCSGWMGVDRVIEIFQLSLQKGV